MMDGHEKSDPAIVAVKPTNKAERSAAELLERRGDRGGSAPAKHALDSEPGSRVTGAGVHTASLCRHTPEVGAVCGKAARTDLCGEREVTRVPTAKRGSWPPCHYPVLILCKSMSAAGGRRHKDVQEHFGLCAVGRRAGDVANEIDRTAPWTDRLKPLS